MRVLQLGAVFALLATAAWAQEQPDFTGVWKLDADRSRIESVPWLRNTVLHVQQTEGKLKFAIVEKDRKPAPGDFFEANPNGSDAKFTLAGQPATAKAAFEDGRLVLTITRESSEGPVTETRRLKLGDKGRIMTGVYARTDKKGEKTGYSFYMKQ